jgi:hypothetical protein
MSQLPCKRFWEGPVGITLKPQKQHSGEYFWTFSLTRAFKRRGKETWEYTDFFGQKHAAALGNAMSRAMQFMEQNAPDQFTERWFAENSADKADESTSEEDMQADAAVGSLAEASFPDARAAG